LPLVLVVLCAALLDRPSGAYGDDEETLHLTEPVFLPPDHRLVRMLQTARKLLEQQRYSEATRALARILNAEEDFFVAALPDVAGEGRNFRSLKNEARRIVGQLPPQARKSYELQFGITAQRMLNRAIKDGNTEAIADVTRRYFHTAAGYRAMVLLGQYQRDQGRALGAALCFQHVYQSHAARQFEPGLSLLLASCWLRAGEIESAKAILTALKRKSPQATFEIGGQRVSFYERDDQALDWLAGIMGRATGNLAGRASSWLMFRGNAARAAQSDGGLPLLVRPRWTQRVARDTESEDIFTTSRRQYADQLVPALPAFQPLALDDQVVMRAPGRLAAVDFRTGKLIWQVASERPQLGEPGDNNASEQIENSRLRQQAWIDKTYCAARGNGFGRRAGQTKVTRNWPRRFSWARRWRCRAACMSSPKWKAKRVWWCWKPPMANCYGHNNWQSFRSRYATLATGEWVVSAPRLPKAS
jgi:thioredoxin-like negative regulator of GroEL